MTPALPPLASSPSPQSCLAGASERGIKPLTSLTGEVILPRHSVISRGRGLKPLKSLLPQIGITIRRFKRLEAIRLIREQRDTGRQDLAFNARPFILCGIPLRRPPSGHLAYTRHNGRFFLEITAHPRFGLPYGQDRLIPIWVATLAVKQRSRVIHFASAAQLLEFFRLPKDGPHYRRMIDGFKRVFAATIFFGTEQQPNGTDIVDLARFQFFDRMHLWFNTREQQAPLPFENVDNVITLSDTFYREINEHRIPVEREVVAALAHAPGVLDFYMWMVWKAWTINGRPATIPFIAEHGLSEQLGTREYAEARLFRFKIKTWLRHVKSLWPECPAAISADGEFLIVESSRKSPAIRGVEKAVNA